MADPIALTALALDAAIGWPHALYRRVGHPVGLFAHIISRCEARWNLAGRPDGARRFAGIVTVLLLLAIAGGGGWLLQSWLLSTGRYGWVLVAILAWPALAQRSLFDHVRPVADALRQGDTDAARRAVSMIVGRDTATLDAPAISRAAIESLAESFCDGVTAPLFWLILGGLPGIWAYKAINTADSLIGHPEPPLRAFGWAAARTDDLLNWAPARMAGAILCVAGFRRNGWRIMMRDARNHASPNAGWTEAAMAGVLRLRLAGPIAYDGVTSPKPWIGDGRADATHRDIDDALCVYVRACALVWSIAGGVTWVL